MKTPLFLSGRSAPFPVSWRLSESGCIRHSRIPYFFLFSLWLAHCSPLKCQTNGFPAHLIPVLEDWVATAEGDFGSTDLQSWLEHLQHYIQHPLSLNTATRAEWESLGLLTALQIECLMSYRMEFGPFIAAEELQAAGCLPLSALRILSPLVTAQTAGQSRADLFRMLRDSRQSLLIRWSRSMVPDWRYDVDSLSGYSWFEGGPDRLFLRFRRALGTQFSMGFTAEKDPGETLLTGSNAHGFDFLSAHLFIRDISPALRTLALGDFTVNLGQGLIMHSGFGGSKSAMAMQIARTGEPLQRYTSVDENRHFRGVGAKLQLGKKTDLVVFASSNRIDASQFAKDSVSSFLTSGLHRDYSERSFENSLRQQVAGGRIELETGHFRVRANGVWFGYDKTIAPTIQPYNRWYFRGRSLLNTSIDYTVRHRGLYLFGEVARSENGALATVNGMLASLGGGLDVALCLRHLEPDYQAPMARAFTENTRAHNETGAYLGLSFRPSSLLTIEGFADLYRHPWVRYRIDAPSHGREWRVRVTLEKRRAFECFSEFRNERKWIGTASPETAGFSGLTPSGLTQVRMHLGVHLSKGVEWRMRINWARLRQEGILQRGWQFHQDVIYKPMGVPLHFSARIAWFDTDSYDVRFYNFENGMMYQFGIPAYYGRAWRGYLNLRWKGMRDLVIEGRWAATGIAKKESDSESARPASDVGLQLYWAF